MYSIIERLERIENKLGPTHTYRGETKILEHDELEFIIDRLFPIDSAIKLTREECIEHIKFKIQHEKEMLRKIDSEDQRILEDLNQLLGFGWTEEKNKRIIRTIKKNYGLDEMGSTGILVKLDNNLREKWNELVESTEYLRYKFPM